MLVHGLNRADCDNDWCKARCEEVQANPDGYLDLWAREHYKSTIITFAKTIQDILINPEVTVGIFSHTRPIAKAFLRQIKQEFESNQKLKGWFPDILWSEPRKEAPKWSEDEGIVVRRRSNPKEATVEAWGLVDGQPTSKHFGILVYDDVVTRESVTTPEMMRKTTDALALSYNLGAHGGARRFIGTRYHYNDTYKTIIDRGTAKPRIYPATKDGKVEGEPVFLTREQLAEKRRDMGPYVFSCFDGDTPVLMSDWTERSIASLEVGDEVVGYTFGDGRKSRLVRSKVLATQSRRADAVRFTFESGRSLVCTEDHKFWHGRAGRGYAPLGLKYGQLRAACSIYDPQAVDVSQLPEWAQGYLAGFFDGEGSTSGKSIHFTQDTKRNLPICEALERALNACGFDWSVHVPSSRPTIRDYYLTGGRHQKMRFARIMQGMGKQDRVADLIFSTACRDIGHRANRDKLVSIEPVGEIEVFNIQTETGNYVAGGYAVKNCQMLQSPTADETQGFKQEWIQYATADPYGHNIVLLFDPANAKKKDSDYTAGWALGFGPDQKIYVHDMVRDRLNLTQRAELVMNWHRRWKPIVVGYEHYGMQADIAFIEAEMERQNYRFKIHPLGGAMPKVDRIRRLIPWFEKGQIYLHPKLVKTNYEGVAVDLTKCFIDEEYLAFPVAAHDDMLDALARFTDPDLPIAWPKSWPEEAWDDDDIDARGRNSSTGY